MKKLAVVLVIVGFISCFSVEAALAQSYPDEPHGLSLSQQFRPGGIKVYDSSKPPQLLGVVVNVSFLSRDREDTVDIFVRSLEAFTRLRLYKTFDEENHVIDGRIMPVTVYYDDSGNTFMNYPNVLGHQAGCDRYFVSSNKRVNIHIVSANTPASDCSFSARDMQVDLYEAQEISKDKLPFVLPVTLPLKYK